MQSPRTTSVSSAAGFNSSKSASSATEQPWISPIAITRDGIGDETSKVRGYVELCLARAAVAMVRRPPFGFVDKQPPSDRINLDIATTLVDACHLHGGWFYPMTQPITQLERARAG